MTHADLVERVRVIVAGDCYGLGEAACRISCECRDRARAALHVAYLAMMEWPQSQKGQDAIWLAAQLQNANDQYRAHVSASPLNGGSHE